MTYIWITQRSQSLVVFLSRCIPAVNKYKINILRIATKKKFVRHRLPQSQGIIFAVNCNCACMIIKPETKTMSN